MVVGEGWVVISKGCEMGWSDQEDVLVECPVGWLVGVCVALRIF